MDWQKFINKFSFIKLGFSEPVALSDAFGFSTTKDRQQNGRNFVSIYKFYLDDGQPRSHEDKKPLVVSVSYAEKLDDGTLRLSPTSIKRKFNWPIDMLSTDEFYYSPTLGKFYFKEKEIEPDTLLERIEALHTKPTKILGGSLLICKLVFWRVIATNFFKILYYVLIKVLYLLAGTKTTKSIWLVNISRSLLNEDKKVDKEFFAEEKINIFGYHASAWSVVVYALLHLGAYSVWYFYFTIESDFIKGIFSNAFLTTAYVIPTLVLFERLIPNLLEFSIRFVGEQFHKTSFRQIKI